MATAGRVLGGAAAGAGTGAAVGSLFPGYGTAIGAGIGGLVGGISGYFGGEADDSSKEGIAQARMKLQQLAAQQRRQREADLQQALGYFGPVQDEITRLYGSGTPKAK